MVRLAPERHKTAAPPDGAKVGQTALALLRKLVETDKRPLISPTRRAVIINERRYDGRGLVGVDLVFWSPRWAFDQLVAAGLVDEAGRVTAAGEQRGKPPGPGWT